MDLFNLHPTGMMISCFRGFSWSDTMLYKPHSLVNLSERRVVKSCSGVLTATKEPNYLYLKDHLYFFYTISARGPYVWSATLNEIRCEKKKKTQ